MLIGEKEEFSGDKHSMQIVIVVDKIRSQDTMANAKKTSKLQYIR